MFTYDYDKIDTTLDIFDLAWEVELIVFIFKTPWRDITVMENSSSVKQLLLMDEHFATCCPRVLLANQAPC